MKSGPDELKTPYTVSPLSKKSWVWMSGKRLSVCVCVCVWMCGWPPMLWMCIYRAVVYQYVSV